MATTTITGTINGVNNTALANKWITFRLVQLGTDSVATATVAQSVDSVQTDANGDFSIDVWNNGDSGKASVLEITIDGSKPESVIIPAGTASIELWDLIENEQADGSTSEQVPTVSALFLRKASNLAELTPTASTARANIGVTIGTDVQAHSAVLDATTASFTTADEIKLDGVEALADVTDATNIAASGGYVAGGTDVALTDGGTGASDAPTARTNLGVPSIAEAVLVANNLSEVDPATARANLGVPSTIEGLAAANNLSELTPTSSTARTNLGVAIGSDVQAHSAILDATTVSFTTAKDAEISANAANIASNDTDIGVLTGSVVQNESDITAAEGAILNNTVAINDKAPIESPTFTGTVNTSATGVDFNAGNLGGELSWNDTEKTLDLVTGADSVTLQLGQEVVMYVRNITGSQVSDGEVVMVSGSQGNKPTITLAQADTVANARKTIGVATQVIPNNSNGFITLIGKVRDLVLDDGTYTEGDVVYLSSTVAGGITLTEPDIGVEIGHVLATSNSGNTNGVLNVHINNGSAVHELEQVVDANTAAIALNTAKVTNATHTGDVTGDTVLTIATDAVDIPMLSATGTPNSTSFLRGDNTWSVPAGGGGGDVATDAIWDAAGDLAVGTGADSASKLSIGTNGQVLTSNGSTATWASVNTGNGDMLASVYDPNAIAGDAFSMNSMIEGTNTKILTPTERSNIASNTSALASLGPASAYPYTTDFQSGVAQTRNLLNIDNLDGYKNNSNLESIYIGSHVTSIDFQAFLGTTGLTSVKIPETVTTLGQAAFFESGLTSVFVPDSVTDMGSSSTFGDCLSLTSAIIGNNVPTIPVFGLANNPLLSSVSLGSSVTTIGASAFQSDVGLTSIDLPSGVTSIGSSAFNGCTTLASIGIASSSAPTLGSNAFLNVSATTVQVPIGATGYSATYGGLTVVYV